MITRSDVLARAPELSSIPDGAEWTAAIADAALVVSPSAWGDRADLATILLAAHAIAISHPEVHKQIATSVKVGQVAKTFANSTGVAQAGEELGETKWGRRYLALRRQTIISALVV